MIGKKSPNKAKSLILNLKFFILTCIFTLYLLPFTFAQDNKQEPIIVNGDVVEYSTEKKEVTATGNVVVVYKGAKLTCQKITVNTQTKDGVAEGNARLEDEKGVIEGDKIMYNFKDKTGQIINSEFRSSPYFGKAEKVDKVSEAEFIAHKGYMTTCNFDKPHYNMRSKKIDFFPHDKVQLKGVSTYVGKFPLAYLPQYTHSLKDPLMHVQIMPGQRKEWGPYLLTAWRYSITDNIRGRIYLDYRDKLGVAEGFGVNYNTKIFGKGDFKYYYTQEKPRNLPAGTPAEFQRYLIRWRHKWDIDERTNLTSEYYKIADSKRKLLGNQYNMLKDYFFREYETDSQPLSYIFLHHNFNNSSIDILTQKRTNNWYTQLEKLPEIKYSLPNLKIGGSPFYFENNTQAASFNYKYAVPSPGTNDIHMNRIDLSNKVSLPMKLTFIQLTPFIRNQETFYDKDINDSSIAPRNIFYFGADASTKFYRTFDIKSNFLGMDINGLRHIITPTISYSYNHEPNIPSSKLKQIDSIDSITRGNYATLELSNKLQTKRKGQAVDFANLRLNTTYAFDSKAGEARDNGFSDLLMYLDILPYSWMRMNADATYSHVYNAFTVINNDLVFEFARERSIGVGERYQRKGGNELTFSTNWRINPKWKFGIYERYQFAQTATVKNGLSEQEYTISRDLHCWLMDITYNIKKEEGHTIWFIFRLKAFPETEFGFNQSYHSPKPGSQSNP